MKYRVLNLLVSGQFSQSTNNNSLPKTKFQAIICSLLFCLLLTSCSSTSVRGVRSQSAAFVPITVRSLRASIDKILDDSLLSPTLIGAKIISLTDGRILYERNSNKLFHPASNMKLLTTVTAMNVLKPDFQFVTSVVTEGEIRDSVLRGNIYVKGCGDPLFHIEDLDSLAAKIRGRGVTTIDGFIIGDVTYFDDLYWGSGWMWDDEPFSDEAFITPLTINDNSVSVDVRPGRKVGDSVEVTCSPFTHYFDVVNSGITSADSMIPVLGGTRLKGENTMVIKGR